VWQRPVGKPKRRWNGAVEEDYKILGKIKWKME
jgi:hypothetical protein